MQSAQRLAWWAMLGLVTCAFLFSIKLCNALYPRDSTDYGAIDLTRIFGKTEEPWQRCGDTIIIRKQHVIHSYPNCLLMSEKRNGDVNWIFDLGSPSACKLIAFKELVGEAKREWKHSDILLQAEDKRIFGMRSSEGRIIPIPLGSLDDRRTQSK